MYSKPDDLSLLKACTKISGRTLHNDISFLDRLLLCGSRSIIPIVACKRTLESIHEGCQGEVKCLVKAKQGVYWPGMYKDISERVRKFNTCHGHANAQPTCPMIPMDIPLHAWHALGEDHF